MESWQESQEWESEWWGQCLNTHNEETKQFLYARYMGIKLVKRYGVTALDCQGASIIDIGGGPVSMLLKTQTPGQAEKSLVLHNLAVRGRGVVVDPCRYPDWVRARYEAAGVELWQIPGEKLGSTSERFDEAWIYNCLQHTLDPALIIRLALGLCDTLRIFEWVDTEVAPGHPHVLTREKLDEWIGSAGEVVKLTGESSCYGKAYYGIFRGLPLPPTRPEPSAG